jgi:hypothetical protein
VRDVQRPICMIVLFVAPLSFIPIAPPARRLCEDTLSTVYPLAMRQSYVAPHQTTIVTSQSKIRVVRVGGWHTVLSGVEARMPRRFAIRHASAATKQILPPTASWCKNAPFVPFLVLAIKMVAVKVRFMVEQLAVAPQTDIAFPQRNCPLRSTVPWCCILSNSEEVEECHDN